MQMFNLMNQQKLTPNQFYLLYCKKENIVSVGINIHQELRALELNEFTNKDKITPKGLSLIEEVESYFKVQKKIVDSTILGKDYESMIDKFNNIFPKIKLPSNKLARGSYNNLLTNFSWFFKNHNYSWETVIKATIAYVNEYELKDWQYMRTARYFIKKQENDKSITSDLADYCAMIESGGTTISEVRFEEKII